MPRSSSGRIIVIGPTGMLGKAVALVAAQRGREVLLCGRSGTVALDLADTASCLNLRSSLRPGDWVINAAAVTDFGTCEQASAMTYAVNAVAPGTLAWVAAEAGARFVHVSTDHFYTGDGRRAHAETDPETLLNVYARSKFAGERVVLAQPSSLVLRTNITGFRGVANRPTIAEWALTQLEAGEALTLFDDYFTSTLDVLTFAAALLDLAEAGVTGLLNVASRQVANKLEFVQALARAAGLAMDKVVPSSVRALPVARAESSGLDVSRAETLLGRMLPDLEGVASNLVAEWKTLS